jgi:hypothetical protein
MGEVVKSYGIGDGRRGGKEKEKKNLGQLCPRFALMLHRTAKNR